MSLHRLGRNYNNVFDSLPRMWKSLYGHALQSYLFNRIVSRRISEHGLKVVIGDLVAVETEKNIDFGKEGERLKDEKEELL